MPVARHAALNAAISSAEYGRATHWSWFFRKICTTEHPTSRPRQSARSSPPAMDMWAPSRSGIEGLRERAEVALEAGHAPAEGGASAAPAQEAALHQRQERGGDLLRAPAPARVVPFVDPVQHAEQAEHHQPGRDVAEDALPHPLEHDRFDALVVAVLLRGERPRRAPGQVRLLAEEHR